MQLVNIVLASDALVCLYY